MTKKKTAKKKVAKKTTTKKVSPKKKSRSKKTVERETVYAKVAVKIYTEDKPLSATVARRLLGWRIAEDNELPLLTDSLGLKIVCENNLSNRNLGKSSLRKFTQEILRGKWQLNCENRIIGKTGLILDGQHTLISLVLAAQNWKKDQDRYPFWKTEPTLATTMAFGASEEDHVVNTLNTGKPRTLADVLFRSAYFQSVPRKNKAFLCRLTEYAIKTAWSRLGVKNAFEILRTHSESIDFIERHPRLLEASEFIFQENGEDRRIQKYVSPGTAACLLYLSACSTSDPREYHQSDVLSEEMLNWDLWDKACEFWVCLAGGAEETSVVNRALAKLEQGEDFSPKSKIAILVKAWLAYAAGESITAKTLKLKYQEDEDGFSSLSECPTVGGIDLGDTAYSREEAQPQDPTPEEIEDRATEERGRREEDDPDGPPKPEKGKDTKPRRWKMGSLAWVVAEGEDPIQIQLKKVFKTSVIGTIQQGHKGAGNSAKFPLDSLLRRQPS